MIFARLTAALFFNVLKGNLIKLAGFDDFFRCLSADTWNSHNHFIRSGLHIDGKMFTMTNCPCQLGIAVQIQKWAIASTIS